jgi:fructokinase
MSKKILGIGNAIIDIVCKVDDKFLDKNSLIKSSMLLIDEVMAEKLSALKPEKIISGGSLANTIAILGQLGTKTAFIGKVGDDELGTKFISEIEKTGSQFVSNKNHLEPSARSFILVTPDANRTMCTFLGCASKISEEDITEELFKDTAILYLEGYLWDRYQTIAALEKAIFYAKKNGVKIVFSLPDHFCVSRHKKDFLRLVQYDIDLLFCNESEALELSKNFTELFDYNKKLTAVITKSEKGCEIFQHQKHLTVAAQKVLQLIDTSGAGDAFAAGFLYGLISGFTSEKAAEFGHMIAAKIIQKFGPRFEAEEIQALKISASAI